MSNQPDSMFGPTTTELQRLRAELRVMVAKRWELARLELSAALVDVRRLAIGLVTAGLLVLVALPVLVVAAADGLDGIGGIDRTGWLLICFALLVAAGLLTGWWSWRRFAQSFVGLEETLEVLREDQAWLEALTQSRKP